MQSSAAKHNSIRLTLKDIIEIDKELVARHGMTEFVKLAWHVLEPSAKLIWGWHLDAICDHLQAVLKGEIKRLLITVPPGTMKSLTASVFTIPYMWGPLGKPSYRSIFASYSGILSTRDSLKCRRLIESAWYRDRWGDFKLTDDQNTKTRFDNNRTGFRIATSVGGTVTGDRGNLVVSDDLINPKKGESAATLEETSIFFWEILQSRVNDLVNDAFIVIMQRVNANDPAGQIIDRDKGIDRWVHLNLPMEFERDNRCSTIIGFRDPRLIDGELLQPDRFSRGSIESLKGDMGSYAYAAQYQQRPVPREGGLIKEAWLSGRYEHQSEYSMIVDSWDTAYKDKQTNSPTAGITFGIKKNGVDVLDVWHRRVEYIEIQKAINDQHHKWNSNAVLIEDKGSGQSLIQHFKRNTKMPVIAIDPRGLDKFVRMEAETPFLEAGKLYLPEDAVWVADFVTELTSFPSGKLNNRVDALSQFLKWHKAKQLRKYNLGRPISVTKESVNSFHG